MHRFGNVFQTALTDILKWNLDDLANLIVNGLRDADASGLGKLLEADRDVHAGSVQVIVLADHIAQIDADAELHLLLLRNRSIALRNLVLDLDGAADRLDDAGELGDDAVPRAAEDVTVMRGDRLLHHGAVHAQSGCGGLFIKFGMAAIPLHIGSENRGKPTLHGRGPPYAKWRRPT